MPTTDTKNDINDFIDGIDPADVRDGQHLREIAAAHARLQTAESDLQAAVDAARAAGDSWTMIGVALQTSKQNAHRKFGKS